MDLTKRISEYLNLKTNYAVVIKGAYGIGKSHYVKNELFPEVKELSVPNKGDIEKYTPILISLFGVNSVEEIQSQIFIELYPFFKTKGFKFAAGLGNSVMKLISGSDFKELFQSYTGSADKFVDYSSIFLCIDDLDRKGKNLKLEEVYGFINNLVENYNAKILIVVNEDELLKEFVENKNEYSKIIEKVIGVSLVYKPDILEIYTQIIFNLYHTKDPDYFLFLNEQKNIIIERIEQNERNLRNLLFFVEHFKLIYTELIEGINTEKKYIDHKNDIINSILNFTLPIAIEYKMGRLNSETYLKIEHLYDRTFYDIRYLMNKKEEEEPVTYEDIFEKKYIKNGNTKRIFFNSIFQYLIGKENFSTSLLICEINEVFNFEAKGLPDREIALNKLSYWRCLDLSSKEYQSYTKILLDDVDKGAFKLDQYPTVFHFASRFENLLGFSIPKLVQRFKRGINKGLSNYKYNGRLRIRHSFDPSIEYYEELIKIIDYCNSLNSILKNRMKQNETKELLTLFENNFEKYLEKVNDHAYSYRHTVYLTKFESTKFWRALRKLRNDEIIEFGFYINNRFEGHVLSSLYEERSFLLWIEDKLNQILAGKTLNKLDRVSYKFLLDKVSLGVINTNYE
ncbi:MAG: hypothetical protein KA734_09370 [Fluviicola sp.]|nr:hypothetical protein [Fluviicola sp.]MBP6271448.1 hypothetical protein [Fluviicola sp.]